MFPHLIKTLSKNKDNKMDSKKSILIRELNNLERYHNPPERMLKIGFNQKRKKTSTKLKLPSSDMSVLMRAEKELIRDIREID